MADPIPESILRADLNRVIEQLGRAPTVHLSSKIGRDLGDLQIDTELIKELRAEMAAMEDLALDIEGRVRSRVVALFAARNVLRKIYYRKN